LSAFASSIRVPHSLCFTLFTREDTLREREREREREEEEKEKPPHIHNTHPKPRLLIPIKTSKLRNKNTDKTSLTITLEERTGEFVCRCGWVDALADKGYKAAFIKFSVQKQQEHALSASSFSLITIR
jgi:hypothetical protein